MKILFLLALSFWLGMGNLPSLCAGVASDGLTVRSNAEAVVEQMRGLNMQLAAMVPSNGKRIPLDQHKLDILTQLHGFGRESVPALMHALKDPEVQMRRNAELAMIDLAGAYNVRPKVDIREALPALIKATEDGDGLVRAWAAQALGEIGPEAKEAVPVLIKLLADRDEGCRNSSCLGLGHIGPAAKTALPALRNTLHDRSADVRRFAERAVKEIEKE